MSFQRLPQEITQQIFELLPKSTIFDCLYVCKLWHTSVAQIYYKELKITGRKLSDYPYSMLDTTNSTEVSAFNQGRWSQKLIINKDHKKADEAHVDNFIKLLSHLPNLKFLELPETSNFDAYMQAILKKLHLTRIQEIKYPYYFKEAKVYYLTCWKFRQTITHLKFRHLSRPGVSLDCLTDFKQLTHLSINNSRLSRFDDLTLLMLLNKYPQLISFQLNSSAVNSAEDATTTPFNQPIAEATSQGLQYQQQQPTLNTDLKELDLTLPFFMAPYIQYFTSCIPSRLDSLRLVIDQTLFDSWIQINDENALLQFAKHLSSIKSLDFQINNFRMADRTTVARFPNPSIENNAVIVSQMTKFCRFVGAIKGQRDLNCHTNFTATPNNMYKCFYIKIQENQGSMQLKYDGALGDYLLENGTFTPAFCAPLPNLKEEVTECPSIINSLFMLSSRQDGKKPDFLQMLDRALSSCSRLTSLDIKPWAGFEVCIEFNDPYNKSRHRKTKYLQQYREDLCHTVKVTGADLSSSIFHDFISSIPSRNIKNLSLLGCVFSHQNAAANISTTTADNKKKNNNILIELGNIAHLDTLKLELTRGVLEQYNGQVFLQLMLSEHGKSAAYDYYKLIKLPPKYKYDLISKDGKVVTIQSPDKYNFIPATDTQYLNESNAAVLNITILAQKIDKLDLLELVINNQQ
jgi:hypothetical protein